MMPDKLFLKTRHYLVCLLLILCYRPATGQEYSYARYDVNEGLAGSVVYDAKEDKDGFLWFATETGVSRFDGTKFRNFTKADGLPDNEIIRLYVDSRNRVWMMPFYNSLCYYQDGKIFTNDNDSLLKQLNIDGDVRDVLEDKQGNLLIRGTRFYYFISPDGQIHEVRKIEGYEFTPAGTGLNDQGQFTGIVMYISIASTLKKVTFNPVGNVLKTEAYNYRPVSHLSIYLSTAFNVFRNYDSLLIHHFSTGTAHKVRIPDGFNGISGIDDTLCTLNTGNGALFFNVLKGRTVRHVLKGKTINNVFHDSEGNWWFLTGGSGIFRIGSFEFTNYAFTLPGSEALAVFSTYKIDSTLYVGSERSMFFTIDMATRQVQSHPISNASINSRVTAIAAFPPRRIILGTDEGAFEYHSHNRFTAVNRSLAIKAMHVDSNALLISAHTGLVHLYPDLSYIDFNLGSRSTCSYNLDGRYYFGAINGLYLASGNRQKKWLGEDHPLLRSRITSLEGGPDHILWVGTHGDGIIGYKDGKVICNIRQKDGLTSDMCRNLFINGREVWVGTDKGLNRLLYDQGRFDITTYTRADGLIADIVNSVYVDGTMVYAGTPAGLTTFDADKISYNSFCKLRITDIHAAGLPLNKSTTGFELAPTKNAIRFDFVGISYRSAGDITYRYRLKGLNDTWQTTRETFLDYPSLPAGDYVFQIVATNKFGVQSDLIDIPFRVEKFLWEKNWFRVLVVLVAWVLIWIFVNNRIKAVRRQDAEKMEINKRMADMEQMALKAQMNPHFIFNSLNSVQQYVLDKDIIGANKFITEFSRLIRLTLDLSSRSKISIYEEIGYLTTYLELEKTKLEDKFTYSVEVARDLQTDSWFIPPMILQPYVENSIRHGVRHRLDTKGHIKLSFGIEDDYIVCAVEDNGVGRHKASQYKSAMPIEYQSKGMTLTERRIAMLNQTYAHRVLIDIEDLETNNTPAGTRVTLRFPLRDSGRA